MKKTDSTYDTKLIIGSVIFITAVSIMFFFYWEITKNVIRLILEAKITYFLIWISSVFIFILHYIKHKDKDVKSEPIFTKRFGVFMDNALGGITYATVITTSLTLLKGLYIQKFFTDKKYFLEFNDLDLTTVFGVTVFLLYFSLMKVIDIGKETYKTQHTKEVFTESKIRVVKDTEMNKIR